MHPIWEGHARACDENQGKARQPAVEKGDKPEILAFSRPRRGFREGASSPSISRLLNGLPGAIQSK